MIIGPSFVFLHFPKCGGTSVDAALRRLFAGRSDVYFDDIADLSNVVWHQTVRQRLAMDPSLDFTSKKIICGIRRLPSWLISRVTFETTRTPGANVPTREMLLRGEVIESNGTIGSADAYMKMFRSDVTHWVRVEHMVADLAAALDTDAGRIEAVMQRENVTRADAKFTFTPAEIEQIYANSPAWAETEGKVYDEAFLLTNRPAT